MMPVSRELVLGPLGLGTSVIGNLYQEITDAAAEEVVVTCWEAGVRYFDTAPHYGLGLAERRLGRALASLPRDEVVVSTKIGRVLHPVDNPDGALDTEGFAVRADYRREWDFSAEGVRRSHEQSQERLALDRIDILYIHDPEDHLEQSINEALPALVQLRESGAIRAVGVGSKSVATMLALVNTGLLDVVMVAGRYTLLEQSAMAELIPAAAAHGTQVVAAGVFNSGLLATSNPTEQSRYEYGAVPAAVLARARELVAVCEMHGVELPHAAIQFALRNPLVSNVTLGIGKREFAAANVEWAQSAIADDFWTDLASRGLIGGDDSNE